MGLKRRVYSRKGHCPICQVSTGSRHRSSCRWAYVPMPHSKQKGATTFKQRLLGWLAGFAE